MTGTRLLMSFLFRSGFGSETSRATLVMVGLTFSMTASLSLICGVTLTTSPTDTDCGVVVYVVFVPTLAVVVVSALTLK